MGAEADDYEGDFLSVAKRVALGAFVIIAAICGTVAVLSLDTETQVVAVAK